MWTVSKKISLCIGMMTGFVVTVQAFQGTFKTFWPGKTVKISTSSKKFLLQVLPMQQDLFSCFSSKSVAMNATVSAHFLSLMQICKNWASSGSMQGIDIERFSHLVSGLRPAASKANVFSTIPDAIQSTPKDSHTLYHPVLDTGSMFTDLSLNLRPTGRNPSYNLSHAPSYPHCVKLVQELSFVLFSQIKQVRIGTAQADLRQIENILKDLSESASMTSIKMQSIFGIAQDIVQHFDGVSITEYDFMVLSQCMLFAQLMNFAS